MSLERSYNSEEIKENFDGKTIQIENFQNKILINTNIENNKISILADLCGIKKSDILIELTGTTLKISGNRELSFESGYNDKNEIISGLMIRLIELPFLVDVESVDTEYDNGLLHITIKKLEYNNSKKITFDE